MRHRYLCQTERVSCCPPAAASCELSLMCLVASLSERQMQPKRIVDLEHEGSWNAAEPLTDSVD